MALTTAQQALLLFKKWLGLGQTTASREFFNETLYPGRVSVYTNQIWTQADQIPTTAPILTNGQTSGVVQYWQNSSLTAAPGTTNAFTSSLLIDAIPFNYGDGTYNYVVKDSLGSQIPFGQGDWIVDTDAGLLTFYSTVPANMPPTISFYKYVGAKGFTSASVSITGSFFGTASFAVSSSFSVSSSFVLPTGLPSGIVSSSTASSPSQGTVRVTINGVNTDVDTGLQTGDSPSFTGLTVDTNTLFVDSANDEVGIGTTSPRTKLDIVGGITSIESAFEKATITETAANGTVNFDINTQSVLYFTLDSTGNWTLNVRGNSVTTLNSILTVGQTVTFAFLVTNGSSAYYHTGLEIDGTSTTVLWQNATAPFTGNTNSIDAYVFSVTKTTTTPTYLVLGSQTRFA